MISNYGRVFGAAILAFLSIWVLYTSCTDNSGSASLSSSTGTGTGAGYTIQLPSQWTFKPHGLQNLGPAVELTTIVLQAVTTDSDKNLNLIEDIDISLPPFALWDGESHTDEKSTSLTAARVPLPPIPPRPDMSSIIFGVATTLDRLDDSLDGFAHWAAGTGTTIIAILPEELVSKSSSEESEGEGQPEAEDEFKPQPTMSPTAVIHKAAMLGFTLRIFTSPDDYILRYMDLLGLLHEEATPQIQWAAIIDDDTFFPSTTRLLNMLAKYNTSSPGEQQHFIGGMSEDLYALQKWGYLAFGGAGIFLSLPLLSALQPYTAICAGSPMVSGDGKLGECIYKFTTTKLSVESSLHQLDVMGDLSGFFEAVRELPTSVHHWKSWAHHDMVLTGRIAQITGQESVLQKFRLQGGWWMTNGFSIVKYSDEERDQAKDGDVQLPVSHQAGGMERTWNQLREENEKTFLHSLEPLRPRDQGKIQYLLESAVREDKRTMSLYYVRRREGVGWNEAESVIRVVWVAAA